MKTSQKTPCGGLWIVQYRSSKGMPRTQQTGGLQRRYISQHRQLLLLKMSRNNESHGNPCQRGQWRRSRSCLHRPQWGKGTRASSALAAPCVLRLGMQTVPDLDPARSRMGLCHPIFVLSDQDQALVQVIKAKRYPLISVLLPASSNLPNNLSSLRPH